MAKSKKPVNTASPVPEYIQQSKVYTKRKITKRKLPSFTEAMLLLHTPELLRQYFEALLAGAKRRDKTSLDHIGEMFSFIRGKGISINLTQAMMQNNVAAGDTAPVQGFDAFVRALKEKRAAAQLEAAPEGQVIDAHPVETVQQMAPEA